MSDLTRGLRIMGWALEGGNALMAADCFRAADALDAADKLRDHLAGLLHDTHDDRYTSKGGCRGCYDALEEYARYNPKDDQ